MQSTTGTTREVGLITSMASAQIIGLLSDDITMTEATRRLRLMRARRRQLCERTDA